MVQELKRMLLNDPNSIVSILEEFDFCHINLKHSEIRFARSEDGGQSISIRLDPERNSYLNVNDYVQGLHCDLFSFLIQTRNTTFREVLQVVKRTLNLDDYYEAPKRISLFGGIYDRITKQSDFQPKIYDDSILKEYGNTPNIRFLKDGISIEVQKKFGIGYSIVDQRITIPIRNPQGDIIGIKGRCNYTPAEDEPKYLYIVPCPMSATLYGYCENYKELYDNTVYVFESEKAVLQCATMGYHNCVSLGSNSLSSTQAKLLLSVNPKKIVWMLDESLSYDNTLKNARLLNDFCSMRDVEQYWWDYGLDLDIEPGSKVSSADLGKEKFEEIIEAELVEIDLDEENKNGQS